jgi:hypothetical protein
LKNSFQLIILLNFQLRNIDNEIAQLCNPTEHEKLNEDYNIPKKDAWHGLEVSCDVHNQKMVLIQTSFSNEFVILPN